jgi:hypothetical protein
MSNELTPEQTIIALYAEVMRLENVIKESDRLTWKMQLIDNEMRRGFKKWAYHSPECLSQFTKEHSGCDCGLKDFCDVMKVV